MGGWTAAASDGAPDPLEGFNDKPFISREPQGTYVGRVVIELWSLPARSGAQYDDIALTCDPVGVNEADLLQRVGAVYPEKIRDWGHPDAGER